MPLKVKICGISDAPTLKAVRDEGADFAGFIDFPRSPRHVTPQRVAGWMNPELREGIDLVVVTVDASDAMLEPWFKSVKPDYLQLHGDEPPERLHEIKRTYGCRIIKALPLRGLEDLEDITTFANDADILLFDAPPPAEGGLPGGNGLRFDWRILGGCDIPAPWMLSGGLTATNLAEAVTATKATMVDVSSGVEFAPGRKSLEKIREFVRIAKGL